MKLHDPFLMTNDIFYIELKSHRRIDFLLSMKVCGPTDLQIVYYREKNIMRKVFVKETFFYKT